jgi:hypothetical protein
MDGLRIIQFRGDNLQFPIYEGKLKYYGGKSGIIMADSTVVVPGVKKTQQICLPPVQECPGIGYGPGIGYNLSGNSSVKTASS